MPSRSTSHLAAIRAFQAIIDFDGKDEAAEFHTELGDMFSLWPAEQKLSSDDISKLAAQLLVKGMTAVACRDRGAFLKAMLGHVQAGLRVIDLEGSDRRAA